MDNQVLNFWKQTWLKDVQFIKPDRKKTEVFVSIRKEIKLIDDFYRLERGVSLYVQVS